MASGESQGAMGRARGLGRRGILAGAATIVAGALARFTAQPVQAGVDGDLVLNAPNTGTATTTLQSLPAGGGGYTVLRVTNLRIADAILAEGGPGSLGNAGARGINATGGNNTDGSFALPSAGGDAILGTGGSTVSAVGNGGRGVRGAGGEAGTGAGGTGVEGRGGNGSTPGEGVVGFGAGTAGSQSNGVRGQTSSAAAAGVAGRNTGTGAGVQGETTSGTGVFGTSSTGVGVRGTSTSAGSGQPGVSGSSTGGAGVFGTSSTNAGVFGTSTGGVGIVGLSPSVAVWGISSSPSSSPQAGVRGESTHGPGVFGQATNNAGVFGDSSGGNIGVFGRATNGTGILAQATDPTGFAAQFFGRVNIVGELILNGNALAGAAIQHQDGSQRRTYFATTTDATVEDVGRSALQGGRAVVTLDRDFAAVVQADQYHVFLTPEADSQGLFVTAITASGFEVREQKGGISSLPFSYRVVAKRRDQRGSRLERVDAPRSIDAPRAPERVTKGVPRLPPLPGAGDQPDTDTDAPPAEERRRTSR